MNPLFILVSLLFSLLPRPLVPAADLNDVIRKAVAYEQGFEAGAMNIVAVEHYEQKTSQKSVLPRPPATDRYVNSDIVMFEDGNLRYPVRCVRNEDGLGAEVPDYAHKEAIAALSTRPDAKAFRRTFNLPTVALMALHPENLESYNLRKTGEEKIAGQVTWKVQLATKTSVAEPTVITLWIQPDSGEIYRSLVEVHALGMTVGDQVDGTFTLRVRVEYAANKPFGRVLPVAMKEQYDDPDLTVEGDAEYTYMPRLVSDAKEAARQIDANPMDAATFKISVDVPLVTLDVSVTGNSGPVTNLNDTDFIVEENGTRQTLSHFTSAAVPYNILLLFDWSGSALEHRDLLRKAASGFVDQLRPDDWIAVGRFAGGFQMDGWTTVHSHADRQISELSGPLRSTNTNLYTSIEQALTGELLPFVGRRRALVVLTDGRDNGFEIVSMLQQTGALKQVPITAESLRYRRLLEIVKQERIPIYIIAVNTISESVPAVPQPAITMAEFHKAVDQRLEEIVQTAGGRVVQAETYEDVVPLINQISRQLGTAYTLGYYSPAGNGPGFHNITVRTKQSGMTVVQSRSGYSVQTTTPQK